MQFALTGELRVEATPTIRDAICPSCRSAVVPKCGTVMVHHWAHKQKRDCDPWFESETLWHRQWKSKGFRTEVVIQNHRADIVSSKGYIVELQHSGISEDMIRQRESCYGVKLRWIFDGTNLAVRAPNGGKILDHGPTEGHVQCLCSGAKLSPYGWTNRDDTPAVQPALMLYHKRLDRWGCEVVTFRWKHARKMYAVPQQPVYIDLPGTFLLKLGKLYTHEAPYGGWGTLIPREVVENHCQ